MSLIFNMPWTQAFDGTGNTLAGAKLYFYETGTSTPQNVYADSDLTTPLSNPVIADGGGRFAPIYLADAIYKVALYTAEDVLIWTADGIGAIQEESDGTYAATAVKAALTSAGLSTQNASNFPYALFKYANASTFYIDSGTSANSYILSPVGNYDISISSYPYYTGFKAQFVCTRPNTATSLVTVNVSGHGAKYIRRFDGTNLQEGDMYGLVTLIYNGAQFLLATDNGAWCVGDIKASALSANHGGWLLCNGQAVSRTDYAVLFALIGTNFGAGDGSTTFNVPDYRGKFLRGLGGDSEDDIYTTQAEGLPNITGTWKSYGMSVGGGTIEATGALTEIENNLPGSDGYGTNKGGIGLDASLSNAIYGASNHVTPINQAVNYFIKAR